MAEIDLRILDKRIGGRFSHPRPTDIVVDEQTPMKQIIADVLRTSGQSNLRKLSLCCHGFEAVIQDERALICRQAGGFGLQLGRDNLTIRSVQAFSALSGLFAYLGTLDIYACAAADDGSRDWRSDGFTGNGRILMRELAGWTGAIVRASDAPQLYSCSNFQKGVCYEGVDFGDWEGTVWMFSPEGTVGKDRNPGRGVS